MRLSCVVPATDAPETLPRCVAAIESAAEPPEELIVIDRPPVSGPAAARNEGARRAGGDVLVFVDADVVVHPDAFRRIRSSLEQEPDLSAVFGSYDEDPEAPDAISGFRNLLHHQVHQQGAGYAQTFWAGLGAIRRQTFLESGGFDSERFPHPAIEDIELGMRLAEDGGRIRLDPALQGTHLKRWSLAEMVRTDFFRRGVPWARMLLERRSLPSSLNLGWRHRLGTAASVAALVGLCLRRPRVVVAGLLALAAVNGPLYALLLRRRGPRQAAVGLPLHALHHVVGAAAGVTALASHLLSGRPSRRPAPSASSEPRHPRPR